MLTTFDLDEYVYAALRAGANGFMLKDVPRASVIAAVRTIAAGESLLAPAITRRLIERYAAGPPETADPPAELAAAQPAREATRSSVSRAADRTPRSRAISSSARPPSRPTSPPSCASSTCATAHRRSSGRTRTGSFDPEAQPQTRAPPRRALPTSARQGVSTEVVPGAAARLERPAKHRLGRGDSVQIPAPLYREAPLYGAFCRRCESPYHQVCSETVRPSRDCELPR